MSAPVHVVVGAGPVGSAPRPCSRTTATVRLATRSGTGSPHPGVEATAHAWRDGAAS